MRSVQEDLEELLSIKPNEHPDDVDHISADSITTINVSYENTVYVGCLPEKTEISTLRNMFSLCGPIQNVSVFNVHAFLQDYMSYGFVKFQNASSMKEALRLNNKICCDKSVLNECQVVVEDAGSRKYVLRISSRYSTFPKEEIHFGEITDEEFEEGKCVRFTVSFAHDNDRRKMMKRKASLEKESAAYLSWIEPQRQFRKFEFDRRSFDVHIFPVPEDVSERKLREMFSMCGPIETIYLRRTTDGNHGLIVFNHEESRDFALSFNGNEAEGWKSGKLMLSREERTQNFEDFEFLQNEELEDNTSSRFIDAYNQKITQCSPTGKVLNFSTRREPRPGSFPAPSEDNFSEIDFLLTTAEEHGVEVFPEHALKLSDEIGGGDIGFVYKARTEALGDVALRKFFLFGYLDIKVQELWHRIKFSSHENIVPFLGVLKNQESENVTGYIMKFMENGTVYEALHHSSLNISDRLKYSWISQAARGIAYLHENNIVYRNMKPSSMLLGNNYEDVRLGDMHTTRVRFEEEIWNGWDVGSIFYTAPEFLLYESLKCTFDESVDVYSLAISAWEIITERYPFDHLHDSQVSKNAGNPMEYDFSWKVHVDDVRPVASAIENFNIRKMICKSWQPQWKARPAALEFAEFFEEKKNLEPSNKPLYILNETNTSTSSAGFTVINMPNSSESKFAASVEKFIDDGITTFTIDDFYAVKEIGEGGFGRVYQAYHDQFAYVAVKIFHNNKWSKYEQRELFHTMKNAIHTNIVQFYGVMLHEDTKAPIGFVMQYMEDKTVSGAIHKKPKKFANDTKYSWICQAGRALDYLHSKSLAHRDVKPANMLLSNAHSYLRLCDMGAMRNCDGAESITEALAFTFMYNAPEMMTKAKYDSSADIYSLAISIWEIVTERKPYDHITTENSPFELACRALKHGERPQKGSSIDEDLWKFLEKSWNSEPSDRPSAAEIVDYFDERLSLE